MTDSQILDRVRGLHRPKSTGSTEYKFNESGGIIGVEPTFVCPVMCEATWYFEGDGCATWKLLSGEEE